MSGKYKGKNKKNCSMWTQKVAGIENFRNR